MKKIGLITDVAFWEMGRGRNARIETLHRFLSQRCALTLYYLGDKSSPFPGPDKQTPLADTLKQAAHDLIIVEYLGFDWVIDLVPHTPVFLDAIDLLSDRAECFSKFQRPFSGPSFAEEVSRLQRFHKIMFLQKEELEKVSPYIDADKLLLCPHPVTSEQDFAVRESVETIGFFGSACWPNIDGMQWFHDTVLPLLGEELAEKCEIHGTLTYSPFAVFLPRIKKGQFHPSLERYYANVDIAINPVPYGSGLKIKTVEAIAHGIPLVTTSAGAQGLLEESGKSFLCADTPQEFAAAIQALAASKEMREQLAARARTFAKQHWTPEVCFAPLLQD